MLKHDELFDPVKRTREMREEEFTKYVEIREKQLADGNEKADSGLVNEIYDVFYSKHEEIPRNRLNKIMDSISPKISRNAGLAQFTVDYGGAESDFFFPWLMSVYSSPSAALEMSYGAGYNLMGDWTKNVPESDKIYDFVRNDPTFVYNRERQLFVADLVMTVHDKRRGRFSKVVDLGAGRMAWARWHGFKFKPREQQVLAFDIDSSIKPDSMFRNYLGLLGVEYEIKDMAHALNNPNCQDADLVMLGGVASYYPLKLFTESVIVPVYRLLKNDGVFFFDLQLDCPYLQRSMKIFDWPELQLKGDALKNIGAVEAVRKELWARGMKFSAEYALDTYNATPSAVMVTFNKI